MPLISPVVSCSPAANAAPAPFETLEAMTMVFLGVNVFRCLVLSLARLPYFSLSTKYANCTACSVLLPQSFSGFCCECACL